MYPKNINPNPVEYGAGKAGLNQMVKYFSSYYGKKNIRINAIVPGPFPNINKAVNNNNKFLSNLKRISKITSGRAFPMCGSSYTVGPQTYIPIFFLSFGINCSFLLVKLFVKKISILID